MTKQAPSVVQDAAVTVVDPSMAALLFVVVHSNAPVYASREPRVGGRGE